MQNWARVLAIGAVVCLPGITRGQQGDMMETETTTSEVTRVETYETETTGETANVMALRYTEKKIEFSIPWVEAYSEEVPVGYRGVDDFFIVREANPNVRQGQWQLELGGRWSTYSGKHDRDDNIHTTHSIKYGITDDLNAELEVLPINLGDGGEIEGFDDVDRDGAGELNAKLFWRFVHERDWTPAMALWTELRIPTGEGSSKVDNTWHLSITKTLAKNLRGHLQGMVKTANGGRGDEDSLEIGDRRHFQWGAGAGLDYSIDDKNLLVLNYMNKTSNYYGKGNTNTVGAGWVHHLTESQQLMVGVDYADSHGRNEDPRWTGKLQWSITW